MKIIDYFSFSLLIISLVSCGSSTNLFHQNHNDWTIIGDANWYFSKNELKVVVDNNSGFVQTNESFKNFELELEFKPDSTINSGVFIRCGHEEINPNDCYEMNIWDLHPDQNYRTGAIVLKTSPMEHVNSINQWNKYTIKCLGNHIQVWINDVLTADIIDDDHIQGKIALQAANTGKIRFRNIKIKTLK